MNQAGSAPIEEIKAVLLRFQEGYLQRDAAALDEFMQLFSSNTELEVIGTGGIYPGDDEWCCGPAAVRELVKNDWEGWGDFRLEMERAHIHIRGEVAWCAAPATVTMFIEREEGIQDYLDYLQALAKDEDLGSPEERLLEILRGCSNTLCELQRGETFVWPLRFSAVLINDDGAWRFIQMQFSFATTRFPDVRINAG
jgi:hypothetical protein